MSVPEPQADRGHQADASAATAVLHALPGGLAAGADPQLARWLDTLCRMLPGVQRAFVGTPTGSGGEFERHAPWPDRDGVSVDLMRAASGLPDGQRLQVSRGADRVRLGRRYLHAGQPALTLVLEMAALPEGQEGTVAALIEWGGAWLGLLREQAHPGARPTGVEAARDAVLAALQHEQPGPCAVDAAAGLARALGAARVSIGLCRRHGVHLLALSSGGEFDPRSQLARRISAAMEEALDECATVCVPEPPGAAATATRAHERLRSAEGRARVCSVPMTGAEDVLGMVTVEWAGDVDGDPCAALQAVAPALGAALVAKTALARGPGEQVRQAGRSVLAALCGPRYLLRKLAALVLLGLLAAGLILDGDHRVSAPAVLEGAVQRALVAPIDGYVARAPARAGDAVREGEVLAELDTRDLELERRRVENERAEIRKTYRKAVATMDRSEVLAQRSRLGMLDAKLALVDEQIERARVVAPFDAMVMRGDLSRSLGAPVSRGEVLFELAPLDDYRVSLMVDEADVGALSPGQSGVLALAALPGESLRFEVETVVGIAEIEGGRNAFRVEGRLADGVDLLRPGMHGVGKVHVDRRPLLWVWTHALVDRVQLWLWANAP
jgi:multidrug efflux pump subunit AcrA (membrane-fusion protein)